MFTELFHQLFGQSLSPCNRRNGSVTTAIITQNDIDDIIMSGADENTESQKMLPTQMPSTMRSPSTAGPKLIPPKCNNRCTNKFVPCTNRLCSRHKRRPSTTEYDELRPSNGTSFFSIYLLIASLVVAIFTISILLLTYVNSVTDLQQLRDNLKDDFIQKQDVELIVRDALKDLQQNHLVKFRRTG